jgi:Glyoxalase-like domain
VVVQFVASSQKVYQQGLLEIDHVFICLSALPVAAWFREAGIVGAEPTVFHPDRGTVSQVVFFETMYLEFIEVVDWDAAKRFASQTGIDFAARCNWQQSGASPFGIGLRHRPDQNTAIRSRRSPQLSATDSLQDLPLSFSSENLLAQSDPLCFVVPGAMALPALIDSNSERYRRKVRHPLGMERLTQTVIKLKNSRTRSQPIQFLQDAGIAILEPGSAPCLELTFDQQQQCKRLDLQMIAVPLVLKF